MKKIINIQEYIDSGILEQYALGMTSTEQNAEIAAALKQYPELQNNLSEIEKSLELFAKQYAKPVPEYLKERILNSIEVEKSNLKNKNTTGNRFLKSLFMLAVPALILSTLYFWNINQVQKKEFDKQKENYYRLESKSIQDSILLVDCGEQLNNLRNKDQHRILLKGTTKSPQSIAVVYYDTTAQKIYLDVLTLPSTPPQKQYQLWAIVSGKPVDLGVLDLAKNNGAFKEIKFVAHAQAFAITLEPYGGQESPSMDQMYVMGGI